MDKTITNIISHGDNAFSTPAKLIYSEEWDEDLGTHKQVPYLISQDESLSLNGYAYDGSHVGKITEMSDLHNVRLSFGENGMNGAGLYCISPKCNEDYSDKLEPVIVFKDNMKPKDLENISKITPKDYVVLIRCIKLGDEFVIYKNEESFIEIILVRDKDEIIEELIPSSWKYLPFTTDQFTKEIELSKWKRFTLYLYSFFAFPKLIYQDVKNLFK